MADAKGSTGYDAEKFAEDIVTCVMQRRFPDWVPSETYQKGKDFLQYQTDVLDFCGKSELALRNEWWQYFNGKEKSVENYEKFCSVVKTIVSNMKFSVGKLLVHVLKLADFAAHLYNSGCLDAPCIAIIRIGEILSKFPDFFKADPSEEHCLKEFHL
ncbi:hypothetical protein AVEN_70248-1 [Araneus ventricosus]|uniref:Uncharacterized protein n=1 Tax=Araneus ventricosus TaxID=182803 RepID=A0A4Y2GD14_ARAVE|nr:hypothetical protein AVEN_70248-1 [Araneus ventricosus]